MLVAAFGAVAAMAVVSAAAPAVTAAAAVAATVVSYIVAAVVTVAATSSIAAVIYIAARLAAALQANRIGMHAGEALPEIGPGAVAALPTGDTQPFAIPVSAAGVSR